MLKIRLQRVGRKHEPAFRLVLTDSKNSTKSGRFKEILGSYDPRKTDESLNEERIKHWMSVGAQPTGTVHNLLINKGILDGKKVNVLPKKTVEAKPEEAPKSETPEEPKAEETKSESAEENPAEGKVEEVVESKEETPTQTEEAKEEDKVEEPATEESPQDKA